MNGFMDMMKRFHLARSPPPSPSLFISGPPPSVWGMRGESLLCVCQGCHMDSSLKSPLFGRNTHTHTHKYLQSYSQSRYTNTNPPFFLLMRLCLFLFVFLCLTLTPATPPQSLCDSTQTHTAITTFPERKRERERWGLCQHPDIINVYIRIVARWHQVLQ